MAPLLRSAALTCWLATAAGVTGLALNGRSPRLVLGLLGGALLLGLVASLLLAVLLARDVRARAAARRAATLSALRRVDHLPWVTTRVPLLRWGGSRYWAIGPVAGRLLEGPPTDR